MNKYDIVFLAGLFPKEKEIEIVNNSLASIQNAANEVQWKYLRGLEANVNDLKVINSPYVGAFPLRYKKISIKSYPFSPSSKTQGYNIGFINLPLIKHFFRERGIKKWIRKWIKDGENKKVIIAYAMTSSFVNSLVYAKQLDPNIITCLIIPDLPQYMNFGKRNWLWSKIKKNSTEELYEKIKKIDGFVLFSKFMKEYLHPSNTITIEGIVSNNSEFNVSKKLEDDTKIFLYAGGLNEQYGVKNLVDSFTNLSQKSQKNFRLILCGSGDLNDYIKDKSAEDSRIIYKGLVSHDEVEELQRACHVLINPRDDREEFVKYSFPSKNLEYMATGRPLMAYKLPSIPDEYDPYIYYINGKNMKDVILEIGNKSIDELNEFGLDARNYVLQNKDEKTQCKKIVDFISDLDQQEK